MWEEDPRWQQAQYKALVWSVVTFGLIALVVSTWTSDWSVAGAYFIAVGIVLAAICIYASIVWTVAHAAMFLIAIFKRASRGDHND